MKGGASRRNQSRPCAVRRLRQRNQTGGAGFLLRNFMEIGPLLLIFTGINMIIVALALEIRDLRQRLEALEEKKGQ